MTLDGSCQFWRGRLSRDGYGLTGGSRLAHRVVYELIIGRIPDGYELDHLCCNRSCVNVAHLEPVTHLENMARARGLPPGNRPDATVERCGYGHRWDENTYINPGTGQRACRECTRAASRRYRQRQREAI